MGCACTRWGLYDLWGRVIWKWCATAGRADVGSVDPTYGDYLGNDYGDVVLAVERMSDEPDYYVEIRGLEPEAQAEAVGRVSGGGRQPWVGIRFECCNVYARVYRNREGTAYTGRCPHCLREVRLQVGPGGTEARFFKAQ